MATTYSSPTYDEDKYRSGIDTSYYTDAIAKYTEAQEKNRENQTAQAAKTQETALRDAYISKIQNQAALKNSLASSGIRGGATETSNLKLATAYGNQRAAANTDYSNSVNSINQAIDENILNYDMDMTSRAEEYAQNLAQAKWQAEREDYANALAQQNWETEMAYQQGRDAVSDEQWQKEYDLSSAESAANIASTNAGTANTEAATAATEQSTYMNQWNATAKGYAKSSAVKTAIEKLKKNKSKYSSAEYQYALARLKKRYNYLKKHNK